MATCPVCQSNIEITAQHFGTLYTCPKCSAVFFVDWNGNPEAAEVEEPAPAVGDGFPEAISNEVGFDPIPGFSNANQEFNSSNDEPSNSFSPSNHYQFATENSNSDLNASSDLNSDSAVNSNSELGAVSDSQSPSGDPAFAAHPDTIAEESSSGNSAQNDINAQAMMDLPPFDVSPTNSYEASPSRESTNPFAEISDFGNSDVSQGAFSYTVFITGVDSAAVRASLREALTDKKFGWEVETLMSQMKGGALTIRSVSAVKASILIQRIKYLPIQVSWRQDVLSTSV